MLRLSRHSFSLVLFFLVMTGFGLLFQGNKVQAASGPCSNTEFGSVSYSNISMPASGTGNYRVWARVKMPTGSTNNTFKLEVDGTSCYTMGGAALPSNTWTWIDYQTDNTKVNLTNFGVGPHNFRAVGTGEGLLLDRLIFTQDTTVGGNCGPPQGLGDDCADPPDTEPPVVNITGPVAAPSFIKDTVSVTATASDNGTISKIDFFVDGVDKGDFSLSSGSPYSFSWNTKTGTAAVSDGPHTIKVRVTDGAGLTSESSRNVVVANGKPDLRVSVIGKSPATIKAGDPVNFSATIKNYGTVDSVPGNITFELTNSSGVKSVLGTVAGAQIIFAGGNDTKTFTLNNTWQAIAGSYTIKATVDSGSAIAEAYTGIDAETNNTLSQSFTVDVVDNDDPSVSITDPAAGAELKGVKVLKATATDTGTGVSSVVFYDGLSLLGTGTKSGSTYSLSWDTTKTGNTSHTIKAVATDGKGNTAEDTVVVTVDNPVASNTPWDMDKDNDVDLMDIVKFRKYYGTATGATREQGDFDGDGDVDIFDFAKFNRYWTGSL